MMKCVFIYLFMYVCMYVRTYVRTCVCVCVCVCVYIYVYIYVCMYVSRLCNFAHSHPFLYFNLTQTDSDVYTASGFTKIK